MVRVGQGQGPTGEDDESEGSFMVRGNQQLPPGFDDKSSQGNYMRKQVVDDMSSQGSYLKKATAGFDDMQSQGSYMMRGYNGPSEGKHLFNADDESDVNILRQSQFTEQDKEERGSIYSSGMQAGGKDDLQKSTHKPTVVMDGIKEFDEEEEDSTALRLQKA